MITSPTLMHKIASGAARKIAPAVRRRRLREPLSQTATPGISSMAGKHLLSLSAIILPVTVQASLNFSRSLQQPAPKIAPSTKADSQGSLHTITIRSTQPLAMRKCRSTLRTWSQNPDQFMAITGLKSSSLQSPWLTHRPCASTASRQTRTWATTLARCENLACTISKTCGRFRTKIARKGSRVWAKSWANT